MRHLAILPLLALAACESQKPPAAGGSIPQATVNAGETTTVAACFTDPNGDRIVYSAASSDSGVATASMSDTTVTVASVAPGSASVTVAASDPGGLGDVVAASAVVTTHSLQRQLTGRLSGQRAGGSSWRVGAGVILRGTEGNV